MCAKCSSMVPRPLQPVDLCKVHAPTIAKCGACRKGNYIPQPRDVPEAIKELPREVVLALRPLDIDTGDFNGAKYGYRFHSSMMTFAWCTKSVESKILKLKKCPLKRQAKNAYAYLMASGASSYKKLVDAHNKFLRRRSEKQRGTPSRGLLGRLRSRRLPKAWSWCEPRGRSLGFAA